MENLTSPTEQSDLDKPAPINRSPKSKEQHAKAAKLITAGVPINKALLASGWSKHKANMGKRALTRPLIAALAKEGKHLKELGRQALAKPEEIEQIVVGRLVLNAMQGKDDGAQSSKLLGSHKSVNCWQSDAQVGVILIQPPASLMQELQTRLTTTDNPSQQDDKLK